jgi:hypothetical protein
VGELLAHLKLTHDPIRVDTIIYNIRVTNLFSSAILNSKLVKVKLSIPYLLKDRTIGKV